MNYFYGVGYYSYINLKKLLVPENLCSFIVSVVNRLVPAQDAHFSSRDFILVHPNSLSQFINEFFIIFHIEIDYDTIQFFNCIAYQVGMINFIQLWIKSTYSFYLCFFLVFSLMQISIFTYLYSSNFLMLC